MELFLSVRKFWLTMGIKPTPNPKQIHHPPNARNGIFLLSLIMIFISTMAFLLFRANTLLEYGSCMYGSLSEFCVFFDVLISIWRTPTIFKMIETCEQFIKMSK